MFFRTNTESRARASELGIVLLDSPPHVRWSGRTVPVRFDIGEPARAPIALARTFVDWFGKFGDCLLWVSEYGIWSSREDLNIYYRLRGSYGDHRQLGEAPGHLFLGHEKADLASYLSLVIQFGWGAHLLAGPTWTYMFVSHDGWVVVASDVFRERILADLKDLSLEYAEIPLPSSK